MRHFSSTFTPVGLGYQQDRRESLPVERANTQALPDAFLPSFSSAGLVLAFDESVLVVVDWGHSLTLSLQSNAGFAGEGLLGLIGYELDCTVAACAPIATQ